MPSQERKQLSEFIRKYKELECLWKVTDRDYKNPKIRSKAKEQLLEILRQTDEDANIYSVTKKINSLRTTFNKERRKVKYSHRSGALEIYTPRLWYYSMLLFLDDKNNEEDLSNGNSDVEDLISDNYEPTSEFVAVTVPETLRKPPSPQSSVASSSNSHTIQTLTRKRKSKTVEKSTAYKEKYKAFGEHVAEKLRSMPKNMSLYCQKLINEAIFNGDCGNLNHTSRIITD